MPNVIDEIVHRFEQKAKAWQDDVKGMREKSPVNPPADTLAFAAREILDLAREVKARVEEIGPAEYAQLHGGRPSVQTVREWCAKGLLEPPPRRNAVGDWLIRKDAVRVPRRARRSA